MKNTKLHERLEFTNVREVVEWAGEAHEGKNAYSYRPTPRADQVTVTFPEMRDQVRALASKMLSMGCAGKHVVLVGKLSYEWVLTYFATLSIGAVLIPLDRDWTTEDLAETAKRADADFLFCDEDIKDKGEAMIKKSKIKSPVTYLNAKEETHTVLSLVEEGKPLFEADPDAYFGAPIDPMKLSLLVFTSGTTGKGKGVMLNQNAVLTNISDAAPYIDFSDKTVGVLPPHHTYGSTIMFLGHAIIGAEIYLSSGIRYVQKELKEQKPGHLVLVPLYLETFYRKIMSTLKDQGKDEFVNKMLKLSNTMRRVGLDQRKKFFSAIRAAFGGEVKTIITGGAPISPEIVQFYEAIGISVLNGYGITECAPLIAVNHSKDVVPGSVGRVAESDKVRIDEPNEDGEGEILVKGPNVMLGYYKDEAATADAFKGGYFRTGDYGKLTKNNVLFITGRKKNLIILSNGKNVYPEEIESELSSIPGIQDIIVYEGQSQRGISYNAIVAEVYPDKEYCEKNGIEDIKAHLKPYVDNYNKTAVPYKKITVLKVRKTDFPKNTLRKIMRFQLDMTID